MKIIYKIIFLIILCLPINIKAMTLPDLYSTNVILYDTENNEILYEHNGDEVINIASLTKIMTTIVAIENIEDLSETITITNSMLSEVPYDASIAGLKVNDTVSYLDLLYASMLPSGADATTALAHGISGTTDKYIELMNEKAATLGLENTHFANVTGYDKENHYSTPKDVLKILLYSLDNPLFKKIYKSKSHTLTNGLKVKSTLNYYRKNTDYDLSAIIGSKTGFTSKAGLCLSSIIKVVDKELILLTFGAKKIVYTDAFNIDDAVTIINYLNDNFRNRVLYKKDEVLFTIPVEYSNIDNYEVKVGNVILEYTDVLNEDDYWYEYIGTENLSYKNKKGEKLGTISYHYKDKIYTEDVFLDQDIRISLLKYLIAYINYVIVAVLFIFLCIIILIKKRKHKL